MELSRLKVNNQYCPCVDEMPYFSWGITSKKQNVMQKSYHITVTGAEGLVWDSGVVESDASVFVEYKGKPFQSFSDYLWTVTATDNTGIPPPPHPPLKQVLWKRSGVRSG